MGNLTQRVLVLFSPQQVQELRRMATACGESVAQLIRQVVEQAHFVKQQQRGRDAVWHMVSLNYPEWIGNRPSANR